MLGGVAVIGIVALAVVLLASSNGANDNFKGVATLYGSDVLSYRSALLLASVATLLGSLSALAFGSALMTSFSGKGLVPDALTSDPHFLAAVGLGAAATVLLATRLGFPISTTHALVGALVGAGVVRAGADVSFAHIGSTFVVPLIGSPLLASALASAQYPAFRSLRRTLGIEADTCACAGEELVPIVTSRGEAVAARVATVAVGSKHECTTRYEGRLVGVEASTALTALHLVSATAVSFARGVNDSPKIAALLLAAPMLAPRHGLVVIALAMCVGGILGARRVAETMSHGITEMSPGQAFTGNLTTALLVLFASRLGLPVSTTHVSCGALFGIGLVTRRARWRTIGGILTAWVTTLPVAAVLAGVFAAAS
ncbi:MAG: inorganic phosphate transporter [Deltaproteobacteria bacterium]|nr:inorganic phosphate transporter [Deltaproteobacteria bacterium]